MSVALTQSEADDLFGLEKHHLGTNSYVFPSYGSAINIPLYSASKREEFSMDITSSRIILQKHTFQTRFRKAIILVRIDIKGPPHRNPDGEEIQCPHIHRYREGYGDKWAEPMPKMFDNVLNTRNVLDKFMVYCNIKTKPDIIGDLFT